MHVCYAGSKDSSSYILYVGEDNTLLVAAERLAVYFKILYVSSYLIFGK